MAPAKPTQYCEPNGKHSANFCCLQNNCDTGIHTHTHKNTIHYTKVEMRKPIQIIDANCMLFPFITHNMTRAVVTFFCPYYEAVTYTHAHTTGLESGYPSQSRALWSWVALWNPIAVCIYVYLAPKWKNSTILQQAFNTILNWNESGHWLVKKQTTTSAYVLHHHHHQAD